MSSTTSAPVEFGSEGRASTLAGLYAALLCALLGAAGGTALGVAEETLTAAGILTGPYYWSGVLAGVALILGAGWVAPALWRLGIKRWAVGGLLGGLLALVGALVAGYVTYLGLEIKFGFLAAGALPALLLGVWLARRLAAVTPRQVTLYLAVGATWLLFCLALAWVLQGLPTPNRVAMPEALLVWPGEVIWFLNVPLVLAAPLLAAALASPPPHEGGKITKSLLWFAAGIAALPLALALFFGLTLRLIPG
jgi:hypothetical protein